MYPVGMLFGLGFDTASEIGLLALAALNFQSIGYLIVAMFVLGWACSVVIWKVRRMDDARQSASS
jgi:high-affinity nickel permease